MTDRACAWSDRSVECGDNTATVLLTPLLRLCALRRQDRDFYRDLYSSAEAMAQIGVPLSPEAAELAFDAARRHNELQAPGHRFWSVLSQATGEALGVAALRRSGDACEFGLMLVAHARDGRHAPQAVAAIVDHAFASLGIERFRVECLDNSMVRLVRRLVAPHRFSPARAGAGRVAWELNREQWRQEGCR